jgi:uncharacterized protein (TIGR00645 family)
MADFIKRLVLAGRWLLMPLYLGLLLVLLLIIAKFFIDLAHIAEGLIAGDDSHTTLAALALLDLVLEASLVVMVMLSGFDNFVSRIDLGDDRDELVRLSRLEAGSLKVKILSVAAVISAIYVLEALITVDKFSQAKLLWIVVLHLTLVATALLFAVLDKLERR